MQTPEFQRRQTYGVRSEQQAPNYLKGQIWNRPLTEVVNGRFLTIKARAAASWTSSSGSFFSNQLISTFSYSELFEQIANRPDLNPSTNAGQKIQGDRRVLILQVDLDYLKNQGTTNNYNYCYFSFFNPSSLGEYSNDRGVNKQDYVFPDDLAQWSEPLAYLSLGLADSIDFTPDYWQPGDFDSIYQRGTNPISQSVFGYNDAYHAYLERPNDIVRYVLGLTSHRTLKIDIFNPQNSVWASNSLDSVLQSTHDVFTFVDGAFFNL